VSVSVVDAQRPSLGSLDERVTALERKPTPEQLGMLRWFDAAVGVSLLPNTAIEDIAFDGDHIFVADRTALIKLRASDGQQVFSIGALVGGQTRLAYDGLHLWVAERNANRVRKIRVTNSIQSDVSFTVSTPGDVVFDGTYIWVPQEFGPDQSIRRFRASDGSFEGDFPVGFQPVAAAFDGANIWVANASSHNVTKLRASDGAVLATIATGTSPVGLAFDGTHMWVTCSGTDDVRKIRVSDNAVVGVFPTGDNPFSPVFDGTSIWVALAGAVNDSSNDSVIKMRISDGAIIGTFEVGDFPKSLVFDGAHVWVGHRGTFPGGLPNGSLNKM
jgi:hypothetical protein